MKKEISKGLNNYLADASVLYFKWHNLHWNVTGLQFKAVHEYLETRYDALALVLDEAAELLKINGEAPLASMKAFLAATSIKELDSVEISVKDTVDVLLADMLCLKESAEKLKALADEEGAYDVVNMLEDHLSDNNKNIWFVKAMLK